MITKTGISNLFLCGNILWCFNFIIYTLLKLGIYDDDPEIITLDRREFGKFVGIQFFKTNC